VPDDPFSRTHYVYRVAPGTDSGYLLYSVGADGRDDGGTGDPLEPATALTEHGFGLDYVFNQSRPPADQD
jgi:hypothetical protein